ncbi:MAG: EamA family transporter RarD [Actinomycetota bacterium]|nr:EamA family transporter RarD [Actinomycetota bacterium]
MEQRKGIWLAVAAYSFWGFVPVFWKALDAVPALELLSHRIVWSVPLLFLIIVGRKHLGTLRDSYRQRGTVATALAGGVLLSINWGVFVWAVTTSHIVEASLGYFINPLVSVALGVIVLREHLSTTQRIAVAIAVVGVTGMTLLSGVLPWISLVLAFSFGTYGLLKKRVTAAPPIEGLFMETTFVAVPAVLYLGSLAGNGTGALGSSTTTTLLLIAAGALTIFPLVLFGAAAQRIPLSTLGILQYIAPILQLLLGVMLYGEAVSSGEWFGFVLVWIALAIYTIDDIRILSNAKRIGPAADLS